MEEKNRHKKEKTVVPGLSLLTVFLLEKNSYFDFNLLKKIET